MNLPLPASERKILSIGEITRDVKDLVEDNFPSVWLRGEISNFKAYASGHYYLTLKDSEAQISAVMFRGYNRSLRFRPEDGMGVIVHGRLSVYEVQGKYQILIDYMEPDGIGALQMAFEQLKKRLAAEGLFDPARKRPLPFLPGRVGIITSMHGAAVHDMLSVLRRRYPNLDILIYPVKVQGEGAKEDIVAALDYFSRAKAADVVILGRGGGSIEDLWAFNEEEVARAVARSAVPVISAVGHETDFTICDFVADLRAPTPSAAAELCVPRKSDLAHTIRNLEGRMLQCWRHRIDKWERHVTHLRRRIPSPVVLWDRWRLKLGDLEDRLAQNMQLGLRRRRYEIAEMRLKLPDPARRLQEAARQLERARSSLIHAVEKIRTERRHRFERLQLKVELLSPKNVLERGYLIGRRKDGRVVTRADQLAVDDDVELVFYDGAVGARVTEAAPKNPSFKD